MNLFATVLTYPAPSANYRGESELNRTVIQKVTGTDNQDYPIFSPESMRNALREVLRGYGLPANRERLHNEDQLAVRFSDLPDTDKYADDFFFGYLVAVDGKKRKEYEAKVAERGEEAAKRFTFKRDSILRMNLARALHPYRHNAVFTQSPLAAKESAYQNATTSALLHRETVVAGFQYPFALNLDDCKPKSGWTRKLLQAIGELNDVAGNHARSYFEFAPASLIVRLTPSLVAGYQTYCFKPDGSVPDVVADILAGDTAYPGKEFYLGGEIVKRGLTDDQAAGLKKAGVTLDRDPRKLLMTVADAAKLAKE